MPSPPSRVVRAPWHALVHAAALAGVLALLVATPLAYAALPVDAEKVTVAELKAKLASGDATSEQLTRLYLNRIAALNQRGPGLNTVRSLNPNALAEARRRDAERAKGATSGELLSLWTSEIWRRLFVDGMPADQFAADLWLDDPSPPRVRRCVPSTDTQCA